MDLNLHADSSDLNQGNNRPINKPTDRQPDWRKIFDFAENNTLPAIPGVDTSIILDLFKPDSTARRVGRSRMPTVFYIKRKRKSN